MSDAEIAALMFPGEVPAPAHWEAKYPQRELPAGAWVTRFAPSPTGYLHTGGLYTAIVAQDLAHNSRGPYFVRIENTDTARELADATRQFEQAFAYFAVEPDERDGAPWGPYEQARRAAIYESHARALVAQHRAYPCFCTQDELKEMTAKQEAAKVTPGYYGRWARCRALAPEDVLQRLKSGVPYVVRFRAPDGMAARVAFTDLIRGTIEQGDNRNDVIILKSSDNALRLPTYHFAHAVDDHLMRVNLVLRGEEWMPSVPLHLQLFHALGFAPPSYAHLAPLMKIDGKSKRKLSKRKDPEMSVEHYMTSGYPAGALRAYLRGLANSNLADIDFAEAARTPIRLDKMGVAGPVFDLAKLDSISGSYIAGLAPAERLAALTAWAAQFDPALADILAADAAMVLRAFEHEQRLDKHPRKDVAKWSDFLPAYRAFLPDRFTPIGDAAKAEFAPTAPAVVKAVTADFAAGYAHDGDKETWFSQIREIARRHRFAPTTGDFKRAPTEFIGPLSEASNVIRVALTGQRQSADLYLIAQVIGADEVLRRVRAVAG
jgi:glutamyl-tRNA synthetase